MASAAKRAKKRTQNQPNGLADHEPLKHQREHGVAPVEAVTVSTGRRTLKVVDGRQTYVDEEVTRTVRRQADARLWEKIEGDHSRERALNEVIGAWRAVTIGTGMRTFDPDRVPGRGDAAACVEFNADLRRWYRDWALLCKDQGVEHRVVTDLFGICISARTIETTARKRNGWAVEEMLKALDVWCVLRGWKKKEATT